MDGFLVPDWRSVMCAELRALLSAGFTLFVSGHCLDGGKLRGEREKFISDQTDTIHRKRRAQSVGKHGEPSVEIKGFIFRNTRDNCPHLFH